MTRGLLYVATGAKFIEEARQSAESAKAAMPDMPIALVTDETSPPPVFDQVIALQPSGQGLLDKIIGIRQSPFDETIFIDTDTRIVAAIDEVFDLLSQYDIAVASASGYKGFPEDDVPEAFFELNTGVIAYTLSDPIDAAFQDWEDSFAEGLKTQPDNLYFSGHQPTFRHIVWKHQLKTYVLPPEYNMRTVLPSFARSQVKVFHGRHDDFDNIIDIVNHRVGDRVIPGYARVFPLFVHDTHYSMEDVQFASADAKAIFEFPEDDLTARDRQIRGALNEALDAFNNGDWAPITALAQKILVQDIDFLSEAPSSDLVAKLNTMFPDRKRLGARPSLLLDMLVCWHKRERI